MVSAQMMRLLLLTDVMLMAGWLQEFALAEMEYQVEELLFKMSALCDGVSLPNKPSTLYYTTDSDGTLPVITGADDAMSSAGSTRHQHHGDKEMAGVDENSLTRLLHLQGIGTQIHDDVHQAAYRSVTQLSSGEGWR